MSKLKDPFLGIQNALTETYTMLGQCRLLLVAEQEENARLRAKIEQLTKELAERAWMP
jgi:regulator of replication initiation timing